jgi:anion-transporting  ArsA/GET3 family ATPase
MRAAPESLLDRRLLIVAGKGGVGKTTVACALGILAAQGGKRTLIAEVDGAGRAAYLLGVDVPPIGEARQARPALSVMSVEGSASLAEYLEIILPVKRVLQAVLSSSIYQYFVAAAPGLKELMTVGKVWYEAERTDDGRRRWDLVIFDAPATGHSLQYLRMPRAAHAAFGAGLVGRECKRIVDVLTDPRRTAVNLVTTAEEMPVNETLDMHQLLRDELRMPLGLVFVNRLHQTSFGSADFAALEAMLARVTDPRERLIATETLHRAREEAGWTAINDFHRRRLAEHIEAPVVDIPFLFAEEFTAEQVRLVAAAIQGAVTPSGRRVPHYGRAE